MSSAATNVTAYRKDAPSDDLHTLWQATLGRHHEAYSIPASKFHQILNADNAKIFVAYASHPSSPSEDGLKATADGPAGPPLLQPDGDEGVSISADAQEPSGPPLGFAMTSVVKVTSSANPDTKVKGSLAALVVSPKHQGQGIGSALHDAALAYLEEEVRASLPSNTAGNLQLGSTFPRIFPGIPDIEYLRPARDWFRKRGWTIAEPDAIDLYSPLPNGVDMEPFISEAKKHGVEFRHAHPADREALMRMQFTEFDSFTVSNWRTWALSQAASSSQLRYHLCQS